MLPLVDGVDILVDGVDIAAAPNALLGSFPLPQHIEEEVGSGVG